MQIHIVRPGETLSSISRQYGIPAYQIIQENELTHPEQLVPGQTLVILFPRQVHVVSPGETLYGIARRYGITENQLYRNNPQLDGLPALRPGESLVISYDQEKLGSMEVNGYAYPFIQPELLRRVLPSMTYLTPFTYGIHPTGRLVDLDDAFLLAEAKTYGVLPLMHLSTLTEHGGFSNELASLVLNNLEVQSVLIEDVLSVIRRKGYYGLDVDFEYVLPEDRERYVEFVARLHQALEPEGHPVIVALAPKTSSDQKGLLYEGHDYSGLGQAADAVLLMTYEWGYTYGPPMAVAPIRSVRAVLDYAVTQIPRNKIFLGVPSYGYDWPLPYIRGETKAKSLSNVEAVDLARRFGAEIQYSSFAQAPYFFYRDSHGREHEVWFEDARSIQAKLALAPEYGLLGAGYWNLMRPFPQNWRVLNAEYHIRQAGGGLQL